MDEASWTFVLVLPKDWTACLDAGWHCCFVACRLPEWQEEGERVGSSGRKRREKVKITSGSEDEKKENEEEDPV